MMPRRIQRRRTKGWTMPPNTIYAGRGSKWGNPYRVTDKLSAEQAVNGYAYAVRTGYDNVPGPDEIIAELAGSNLACWCSEDAQHCHVDYLLHVAAGGDLR